MVLDEAKAPPHRGRHRLRWQWIGGVVLLLLVVFAVAAHLLNSHAEPMLRARVVETLTARFQSKVEMAEFHVWVADGLEVSGKGLKIFGQTDPNIHQSGVTADWD